MQPVDLFRRDGVTAYSHDVQVDDAGIAWVSGDGGTRGYWTDGPPLRPARGRNARRPRRSTRSPTAAAACRARSPPTRPAASSTTPGGPSGARRRRATRAIGAASCCSRPRRTSARREGVPRPRPVQIASLEGSFDGEAWRSTPAEAVPAEDRRHLEPVPEGGLAPGRRPLRPARQLLLGPLLRRGRQHGDLRLVRRGHALPRHLGPGEPDPVRVLAAGRRHRLGVLPARRLRLHGGPHPRRGRAEADDRGDRRPRPAVPRGAAPAMSRRQRRFLSRLAITYKGDPGTAGICLIQT